MSGTPHKLPRAPDDWRGKLPRTADVLSGALPTYYGPGQHRAAGEPAVDLDFGSAFPYEPPAEWPGPGRLLRVPQVVHCPAWAPSGWRATLNLFRSPEGPGLGRQVYHAFVANPSWQPPWYAAFHDAKAHVEAVRPGRTWVMHETQEVTYYPFSAGGAWMDLVVPRRHAQFLGTDYLLLACGWPRLWGAGRGANYVLNDSRAVPDPYLPGGSLTGIQYGTSFRFLDDPLHESGVAEVLAATPWFARRAVRLWDLDAYLGFAPRFPDPPTTSGPADIGGDWSAAFVTPVSDDEALGWQSSVAAHNAEIDVYCVDRAHYWQGLAADMRARGLDYRHEGRMSSLTAAALIELIAAHFGFDPDTGQDLPA